MQEKVTWRVSAGEGARGGECNQEAEDGDQQQTREHRLRGEQDDYDVLCDKKQLFGKMHLLIN